MKENNVIHLVDVLKDKKPLPKAKTDSIGVKTDRPTPLLIKRAVAFLVDLFTILLLKASMDTAFAIYVNSHLSPINASQRLELVQSNFFIHASIFIAVYFGYFLYSTFILNGKTIGKMVMAIRVVSDDFYRQKEIMNSEISFKMALKRSFGYLLCYFSFGTFFIFNFSSEDKRGLSDFISDSRTVSDNWFHSEVEKRTYDFEAVYIDIQRLKSA